MDILGQLFGVILGIAVFLWLFDRIVGLPFRIHGRNLFRPVAKGTTSILELSVAVVRAVLRFFFPETFGAQRQLRWPVQRQL